VPPKKSTTPKPPRPVQAPRRRDAPRRAIPRWVWIAGIVGIIAVAAIAGGVIAFAGGSSKSASDSLKATMVAAGCTYRDVAPLNPTTKAGGYHADVPKLTTKVKWSTSPPSAGGHYAAWAVWGFYRAPVNPRQVVHNEEHGGVVIWWGPKVPASTVDRLEAFYDEKPAGMLGTPIASLGDRIALTAWTGDPARYASTPLGYHGMGHIAICSRFDESAFRAFRDAYRGKGPEGIPLQYNEPGSGPN
jgi:hypothetical protein